MILDSVALPTNNMAKNRRTIITELFQAFAKNDDFEYSEDYLWELFKDCVDKKLIKKLTKEKEGKKDGVNSGPKSRGKSGYQHFLAEFSDPIPEGMKKREVKNAVWAKLTKEEKEEWNKKAAEVNEAAGIHKKLAKKKKKPCKEDLDKYEQLLMEWSSKDPETRGPMPSRPSSEKSSPASSPPTSPKENSTENLEWSSKDPETRGPMPFRAVHRHPASSPPTSPKENSTENSNADDEDLDEKLTWKSVYLIINDLDEKLANLQFKEKLANLQFESDSDSDSDDDDANNERIEWLKLLWSEQGWKKNYSAQFKAWIMFTNTDIFGPNKDNNMSNAQFSDFKKTHDYASRSKDEAAPWFNFLEKNAIM